VLKSTVAGKPLIGIFSHAFSEIVALVGIVAEFNLAIVIAPLGISSVSIPLKPTLPEAAVPGLVDFLAKNVLFTDAIAAP